MIIYKDKLTGDELASDIYQVEKFDLHTDKQGNEYDFNKYVLRFKCKYQTEKTEISDDLLGGNASAETETEQSEASSSSGVNLVLAHKLTATPFGSKSELKKYFKSHLKKLRAKLKEEDKDLDEEEQKGLIAFLAVLCEQFDEFQFYLGENMVEDGALVMEKWEGETPYMHLFKCDLEEEKV